nr:hypothetical protein [Sphingobium chungbukense]
MIEFPAKASRFRVDIGGPRRDAIGKERRLDRSAVPIEQADAQAFLKAPDTFAQRLGSQIALLGRAPVACRLHERQKMAQLPDFHFLFSPSPDRSGLSPVSQPLRP